MDKALGYFDKVSIAVLEKNVYVLVVVAAAVAIVVVGCCFLPCIDT